ncbi:methylenetetrahydrofolate reductase (NADPH) [Candidatus Planktophila dulcis]|uniref:methylenetetrahydrofolate reductase [NAD(P)H] n=1 Tax=Candidatus Planktophila dulcis TaxID=1884914 RepID=UPI000BC07DCA|nr:methylenetetrahydrofolate reductase [NAD(P)H] [Candidatus Planktophila dulcis]ASY15270.1 methylenetetrahydrofolate reductase (NADPH) [Candidatus Planktophila dulcis]ASY21959.1 methylenetetrahydrofolate reductase (NADPH) [Candidatus Planktophila dulcis]
MRSVKSGLTYSFEFFPPKDTEGEERLWAAMSQLESIAPDFISVTYGAGGSTRDRTIRITSEITARIHVPTVAHLTCVGSTRTELIEILGKYRSAGIKSILALRGDPTGGPRAPWTPTEGGLSHADELVTLAAEFGGFTIGVAAFPDGHPSSNGDIDKDVQVLLEKEKRGATFATTQFFFDVTKWKTLVDKLAAKGSTLPIIPGILPVTNVKQLNRMAELSGVPIPAHISESFSKIEDNADDVRKLGVEIATKLCQDLLEAGAPGLHFYTMNTSSATREIYSQIKDER